MNLRLKLFALTALICGVFVASAVEPVAVWSGDFNETTKGNYTLSANGNTVAADGSSITISTQTGVTIARASALGKAVGMTVVYKFDNLVVGSTVKTIATASAGGGNADRVGVNVQASGQTSGIWANTGTYNTSATRVTLSSIEKDGQFALVYGPAVSNNTGTYLYLKDGNSDYTLAYSCGGLKGGDDTVQAMTVGGTRNNGGTFPSSSGMVIRAVALFDQALTKDQIAAYEFPKVAKKNESVLLLNFGKSNPTGWVTCNEMNVGGNIPQTGTLSQEGSSATFRIAGGGNFFNEENKDFDLVTNGTFSNGTYRGTDGKDYETIEAEVKASLGLADNIVFDSSVYGCGLQNGGFADHTATIGGLDATAKYIVYVGYGMHKSNQCAGFKITSDQCLSVESIDYVTTVAGTGTSVANAYTASTVGTELRPGENGLLIVRLTNVVPTSSGEIKFAPHGERSGINFLAVAKVNETVTYTTAKIDGGSEISVKAINEALTETNDKAEVTLAAGATVYVDATPTVSTKLICEGSITLSANAKPDLTKLDLSGVTGGVIRTWLTDAEKKGIGFNFASKRGPVTSAALVPDTAWYDNNDGGSNDEGKNGTNVAMSSDGLTTITWTSANTYDDDASTHGNNSSAPMVRGYLDDANGVSITVKNIPYAEYAVIIYASTDDPNNPYLTHKVVNDVNYTYDSTCSDVAKEGTDAWGQGRSSSTVAYGTNAIRVIEQTKGTLTITSPKNTSIKARGCVSAIQIVPYSSFVAPTATIASVETKCSEDYASNTITGTIADYVANSWEGDLTARVVVDSKVYESAAIEDNKFTIEVSDLKQATVYRTVLEVGYTDGEPFNAVATKAIALYQGERKFVWIASPFVIQEKTLVNEAQGLTIGKLFESPDYVDLCDSEYTVSISASEAVDAENDAALDGTEQGGVRIAQMSSGLKLQVVDKGSWVDFADAAVNTTYTLTIKFHYKKSQEGETDATSVTYTLDSTSKTSANTTGKQKVTEIFVSDGTNLAEDLFGACQLDSAVIVDIELKPGEGDAIDYNTEAEANAAIKTLKIGICDAVKKVLTTAEAQENYRKYFHLVVVPSKMLENGFSVMPEFTTEATNEIEKDLEKALADVVNAFNTGSAEIVGKPGLYYGVKRGETLEAMSVKEDLQMADADGKVTITITKPDTSKSHFYRIIVSPTPAETK